MTSASQIVEEWCASYFNMLNAQASNFGLWHVKRAARLFFYLTAFVIIYKLHTSKLYIFLCVGARLDGHRKQTTLCFAKPIPLKGPRCGALAELLVTVGESSHLPHRVHVAGPSFMAEHIALSLRPTSFSWCVAQRTAMRRGTSRSLTLELIGLGSSLRPRARCFRYVSRKGFFFVCAHVY